MNRRTVEAITLAITNHEYKMFKIFMMPQKTDGFWQMCIITPDERYRHMLNAVEYVGKAIGSFYGEGLGVEKGRDYIIFS